MCYAFQLFIVNGRVFGDLNGEYTYCSNQGASVNDYFICSPDFFEFIHLLNVGERSDSDHLPLELTCKFPCNRENGYNESEKSINTMRIVWNDNEASQFLANVKDNLISIGRDILEKIDTDVNGAIMDFVDLLSSSASCMLKSVKKPPRTDRLNKDCRDARRNARRCLRRFRLTHSHHDRRKYCESRNKYKTCCRKFKFNVRMRNQEILEKSVNSPSAFWKTIRHLQNKGSSGNNISKNQWLCHFKNIYSNDQVFDSEYEYVSECESPDNSCYTDIDRLVLDSPITEQEILNAINHLKNGKAAGPDHVIIEMLKCSRIEIMPFLIKCFNKLFDNHLFPCSWSNSIIIPIHKKGDRNDADNYRGISLMSILGKVFTLTLNNRLSNWANSVVRFQKNKQVSERATLLLIIFLLCMP